MCVIFFLLIQTVVSIIFAEEIKGVPKSGDSDDDSAVFTASTIPFDDTYISIVSEVTSIPLYSGKCSIDYITWGHSID